MHFRVTKTRRNGKTFLYGQIVESFRRKSDGMPMHRVVAGLGRLTEAQAANLRAAFAANKAGRAVVVLDEDTANKLAPSVEFNRQLAGPVACLDVWTQAGFDTTVAACLGKTEREVSSAKIVAALVAQRCLAPDSKLAACSWFPKTTMPELLDIEPSRFNNSRVHRVLAELEAADEALQEALAERLHENRAAPCSAFFIDVTDTWFEGRGCDLASRGKTKEGMVRRMIGIVLLCDELGVPMRWKLVEGRTDDGVAMLGLLNDAEQAHWLGDGPLVCDRALGNGADLRALEELGLQYVTALCSNEHEAFGVCQGRPTLEDIDPEAGDADEQMDEALRSAGWRQVSEDLYLRDFGVVTRGAAQRAAEQRRDVPGLVELGAQDDRPKALLTEARRLQALLDKDPSLSKRSLARSVGMGRTGLAKRMSVLLLAPDLLAEIEAGRAVGLAQEAIARVAVCKDDDSQRRAFAEELVAAQARTRKLSAGGKPRQGGAEQVKARVLVSFNFKVWRTMREAGNERAARLHAAIRKLNANLSPTRPGSGASPLVQAQVILRRHELSDVYQAILRSSGPAPHVELERDEKAWRAKRGHDGFFAYATHPALIMDDVDVVKLYRSKDRVEKDFQTIKSVLKLRPLRHRTDAKVRAHVTICVLALAVQRLMEQRLERAGQPMTACRALAALKDVHLNGLQFPGSRQVMHIVTKPNGEQRRVVGALGLDWALEDKAIGARLHHVGR